jgi:HPr kinase/phosphorylase
MTKEFTSVLDVKVPSTTIPVRTGRNVAIILEIAAITSREKKTGYNAAVELFKRVGIEEEEQFDEVVKYLDRIDVNAK